MNNGVPRAALRRLRAEVGPLTDEWRAACASDSLQPAGHEPADASVVLVIVSSVVEDQRTNRSAPQPDLDRVADALAEGDVSLEVVVRQLGCLRDILQSRLPEFLPPDALAEALHRLNSAIDSLVERCASRTARRLEDAAFVDPLTGLFNRRALERDLSRELAQVQRGGRRLSVIMSDVNGLKEINDQQGHAAGDRALCSLAGALAAALRGGDSAYRLGGDEFVVLLPETPLEDVAAVVARIVASSPPGFSWGAATATAHTTAESLLDAADRELLERRRSEGLGEPRALVAPSSPAGASLQVAPHNGASTHALSAVGAAGGPTRPGNGPGGDSQARVRRRPADEARWRTRPVLAAAIRALAFVVPLVASLATALTLAAVLPEPETGSDHLLWWVAVLAASAITLVVFDAVARRILPLAALLRLSLVFPDRAPSRLGVALRSGSTRLLRDRAVVELREGHQEPAVAARTILTLAASLSAHDRGTRGHSERVRAYADLIADELGLHLADRDRLRWAALLHDVGKLSVSPSTLNSHVALTPEDWEALRRHPQEGARLAAPLREWLGPWATAIEQHHERYDGSGYPHGLSGEELSLAARIVAVADAYDAMTSVRSYTEGISPGEARRELARQAGTHFDPVVVRAFLNVALGRLRWVMGPLAFLSVVPMLPGGGIVRRSVSTVSRTAALGTVSLVSTVSLVQASPGPLPFLPPPFAAGPQAAEDETRWLPPGSDEPLVMDQPGDLPGAEDMAGPGPGEGPYVFDGRSPMPPGPGRPQGPGQSTPPGSTPAGGSSSGDAGPGTTQAPASTTTPPTTTGDNPATTTTSVTSPPSTGPAGGEPRCPRAGDPECEYFFDGFFSPVSNTETNAVSAGSTVPFKWKLTDRDGKPVTTLDAVVSARFSDGDDGATYKLTYDSEEERYELLAKTSREWEGSEKTFVLTLDDGTTHTARFMFRGQKTAANSTDAPGAAPE